MITLTATIDILSEKGTLTDVTSNLLGNNISSNLSAILGNRKCGSNPFIIGSNKLGDGSTFSDGEDYFIGSELSDDNGNFQTQYEIVISGTNISSLTIVFDDTNKRYPNSIIVDDKVYDDDDAVYTIMLSEASTHTILINNWNKANSPLIITGIYVDISIAIDRNNILALEIEEKDRSSLTLPSFGIISNKGNISFNDIDGEMKDYAEMQLLKQGLIVKIYLNNTLKNLHKQIGEYITDVWDYDNYNRQVTVSITDNLEEWQDINISALEYYNLPFEQTGEFIYNRLRDLTPNKYAMLQFEELDNETKKILQQIKLVYPMINSGSLWSVWQKFCETFQCHIYTENGKIICKYNGGN